MDEKEKQKDPKFELKVMINRWRGIEGQSAIYAHKYKIFEVIDKMELADHGT